MSPQGLHLIPSMSPNCLLPGAGRVYQSTSEVPRAGSAHLYTGRGEEEAQSTEMFIPPVTQSLLGDTSVTKNPERDSPED